MLNVNDAAAVIEETIATAKEQIKKDTVFINSLRSEAINADTPIFSLESILSMLEVTRSTMHLKRLKALEKEDE